MKNQVVDFAIETKVKNIQNEIKHFFPDVRNAQLEITPEKDFFELKLRINMKGKIIIVTEISEKIFKGLDKLYKKVLRLLRKKQAKTKSIYLKMA